MHKFHRQLKKMTAVQTIKAGSIWGDPLLHISCRWCWVITNIRTWLPAQVSDTLKWLEVRSQRRAKIRQTSHVVLARARHRKHPRALHCFVVNIFHTRRLPTVEHSTLPAQCRRNWRKIRNCVLSSDIWRPGDAKIHISEALQLQKQGIKIVHDGSRWSLVRWWSETATVDQWWDAVFRRFVALFWYMWELHWITRCQITPRRWYTRL